MDLWLSIGPSMVFFAVFHLLIKHVLMIAFMPSIVPKILSLGFSWSFKWSIELGTDGSISKRDKQHWPCQVCPFQLY